MQIEQTVFAGVLVLTLRRHGDARGFFSETWNGAAWAAAGVDLPAFREESVFDLLPDNALTTLCYQQPPKARGLLLRAAAGAVRISLHDGREAATGQPLLALTISAGDGRQVWIPPGILAGWEAVGGPAKIICNATDYFEPDCAVTVPLAGLAQWQLPFLEGRA